MVFLGVILVITMLASGCGAGGLLGATQTPTATETPTATITPTRTPEPTEEPIRDAPIDYPFENLPGWLAFNDFDCDGFCTNVSIIRPDFSDRQRLTDHEHEMVMSILWSPNGRYIAILLTRLGETGGPQLRLYDFQSRIESTLIADLASLAVDLAWSPDSRFLLLSGGSEESLVTGIQRVDIRTHQVKTLIDDPGMEERTPAWSPDGSLIVFSGLKRNSSRQLWMINADGSNLTQLSTAFIAGDTHPSWHPNGSQFAFYRSDNTGKVSFWTMGPDGSYPTKYLDLGSATVLETPVWSPDGQFVAFIHGNDSQTTVTLFDFINKVDMEINRSEGVFTGLSWAPDSSALTYVELQEKMTRILNLFVFSDPAPFGVDAQVDFLDPAWSPAVYQP